MAESLRVHSLIARAALHSRASAGCNFGQTAGPNLIKFGTREGGREGGEGGEGRGREGGRGGRGGRGEVLNRTTTLQRLICPLRSPTTSATSRTTSATSRTFFLRLAHFSVAGKS